jgi:hypothetical protein
MFQKPNRLGRGALVNGGDAGLHCGQGLGIWRKPGQGFPFHLIHGPLLIRLRPQMPRAAEECNAARAKDVKNPPFLP